MGRSDGTLVKNILPFDRLIPYIMDRRYDATNYSKLEFDMTSLHKFLREQRAAGNKAGIMDAVITAYAMVLREYPELNRFVANKRIYQRSHVCVSFVILKQSVEAGPPEETAVKVYIDPGDDLFKISQKIRDTIKENEKAQAKSALDKLVEALASAPLLPGFLVGCLKCMDRYGLLPRSVIALSPFHTSLFIANLASLHMDYVHHHLYEFGTTSLFITLGLPRRVSGRGSDTKRVMTLGVSMDERTNPGATWAKAMFIFKKNLENPERLVNEKPATDSK